MNGINSLAIKFISGRKFSASVELANKKRNNALKKAFTVYLENLYLIAPTKFDFSIGLVNLQLQWNFWVFLLMSH
jgi:hypothetical protein